MDYGHVSWLVSGLAARQIYSQIVDDFVLAYLKKKNVFRSLQLWMCRSGENAILKRRCADKNPLQITGVISPSIIVTVTRINDELPTGSHSPSLSGSRQMYYLTVYSEESYFNWRGPSYSRNAQKGINKPSYFFVYHSFFPPSNKRIPSQNMPTHELTVNS